MASGIKVGDGVKELCEKMKVVKNSDEASQRMRLVTFVIKEGFIEVDKLFCECDLHGTNAYTKFVELLSELDCFYFLYDCHFVNQEGIPKEDLIFGSWVPDCTPIKQKMMYASSKASLKRTLKGIKHDLQLNELEDIKTRTGFAEKINMASILSIEGEPLK